VRSRSGLAERQRADPTSSMFAFSSPPWSHTFLIRVIKAFHECKTPCKQWVPAFSATDRVPIVMQPRGLHLVL
jgi:hypothetical protein